MSFLSQCKITQVQNGFVWGNQIIPVFDDHLLPVFGTIAVSPDVLAPQAHIRVKEVGVGNDPSILGYGECVVGSHPTITTLDIDFILIQKSWKRPGGRSLKVVPIVS